MVTAGITSACIRVYRALRLHLPRRTRRRVPQRLRTPLVAAPTLNMTWAIDFMLATLYGACAFARST